MAIRRSKGATDWRRATHPMPASFTDQSRRDEPVQGRRNDDGLDLVEAIAAATALAATAELASGDAQAPVREDAVGLGDDDLLPTENERAPEAEADHDDDED